MEHITVKQARENAHKASMEQIYKQIERNSNDGLGTLLYNGYITPQIVGQLKLENFEVTEVDIGTIKISWM